MLTLEWDKLCDPGQVTEPLWASVSLSAKWNNSTYLGESLEGWDQLIRAKHLEQQWARSTCWSIPRLSSERDAKMKIWGQVLRGMGKGEQDRVRGMLSWGYHWGTAATLICRGLWSVRCSSVCFRIRGWDPRLPQGDDSSQAVQAFWARGHSTSSCPRAVRRSEARVRVVRRKTRGIAESQNCGTEERPGLVGGTLSSVLAPVIYLPRISPQTCLTSGAALIFTGTRPLGLATDIWGRGPKH